MPLHGTTHVRTKTAEFEAIRHDGGHGGAGMVADFVNARGGDAAYMHSPERAAVCVIHREPPFADLIIDGGDYCLSDGSQFYAVSGVVFDVLLEAQP